MAELSAALMPAPELDVAHASRPMLYRAVSPSRLAQPAVMPYAGAAQLPIGHVTTNAGRDVFSVAPGEWFVRLAPGAVLPEWHETMLVSSCSDSHVEWRISPGGLDAIFGQFGSHAPRMLAPGEALVLGIAGERMMAVCLGTGEALLYHEAALLYWFAGLLRTIQM